MNLRLKDIMLEYYMSYKYTINEPFQDRFKDFLINIQNYFTQNSNSIHKARNELKIIPFENYSTVVKSFKIPNILRRIFYTYFRDTKAKKSYDNSLRIKEFAPTPIGYIEFFQSGLLHESYFISEEFQYDFTIREPLLDVNFPQKEEVFKAFARFTLELHNQEIFHNDYSPGNILIKKENNDYIFKIVDVNRMMFFQLSELDRAKSFAKLWASDAILSIMAEEYKKHYPCSDDFVKNVLSFSNKNKRVKNFKKRLKGKPVND